MGRMGSGIAKTMREKFPNVYVEYMAKCNAEGATPDGLLGDAQFVFCGEQTVVNMFAQRNYGYDGMLYTNYEAFQSCLKQIRKYIPVGKTIAFPYRIGCGLGGGKWEIVVAMIQKELGDDYEIEVWKYNP